MENDTVLAPRSQWGRLLICRGMVLVVIDPVDGRLSLALMIRMAYNKNVACICPDCDREYNQGIYCTMQKEYDR